LWRLMRVFLHTVTSGAEDVRILSVDADRQRKPVAEAEKRMMTGDTRHLALRAHRLRVEERLAEHDHRVVHLRDRDLAAENRVSLESLRLDDVAERGVVGRALRGRPRDRGEGKTGGKKSGALHYACAT